MYNKKIIFTVVTIVTLIFVAALPAAAANERLFGSDRYETAVAISQSGWNSAQTVIIARGDDFPDALSGTPLAYHYNAPILLTRSNVLTPATKAEIQRLGAQQVIILGGAGAVSPAVASELSSMGLQVDRIGGSNRYETAQLIAERMPTTSTAVIAYGRDFPDALAIASHAAIKGYPILLTDTNRLPAATEQALTNINQTIVVGGSVAISNNVLSNLPNPQRISGSDRFDTVNQIIRTLDVPTDKTYVATGLNFADALTGSALAAQQNAAIILVRPQQIPGPIQSLINDKQLKNFTMLGGELAISPSVATTLSSEVTPPAETPEPKPEPEQAPAVHPYVQSVIDLTNIEREKEGLAPLQHLPALSEIAQRKSQDMFDNQYFGHTSPTYGSPFDMMRHYGISYRRAAENLAAGFSSPQSVVNGWMRSPGHRANIMNPDLTHIGIGYYHNANDPQNLRHYWTQMFITPF